MQLNNPNLFLEQILTQLESGREYSHIPIQDNKSCVLIALENKEYDAAEYIISKMALNIDATLVNQENWLNLTKHYYCPSLDEKIISLGADVTNIDKFNKLEPIVYAILENNNFLLSKILDNNNYSQQDIDKYFHLACNSDAFNCLSSFKEHGANINSIGITGNTPLIGAIENQFDKTINRLIDLNVDFNLTNAQDVTPVVMAASRKDSKTISQLSEHGADINYIPYLGNSALMIASRFGDLNTINELFKKTVETEIKNCNDQTAMDIAIEFNQIEAAHLLQENGAKCNNIAFLVKSNIEAIREKVFGAKKDIAEPN